MIVGKFDLWVVFCLVLALVLRRHPMWLVIASLALWTAVPAVASGQITGKTGGSLGFHAATWLIFATFLACLVTDPRSLAEAFARRYLVYIAVLLVVAAAILETKAGAVHHGVVPGVDEMAAPFLAFWIVSATVLRAPELIVLLRNTVVTLAVVEAGWAIAQYASSNVLLYGGYYIQRYWYVSFTNAHRWMGTTDHPLVLSLLICAAIPLIAGLDRTWLQPALLVVLLIGLVISQSRSGVVAGAVGTIYVVLTSRISSGRKTITIAAMAVAAAIIATSALSTGVADRVANDNGSALARGSAWSYFFDHWGHYVVSGGGLGSSYSLASTGGLDTSFESAFLMYSIDLGILLTVLYFAVMIALVVRGYRGSAGQGAWRPRVW